MTQQFNRKKFMADAEVYLLKRLVQWVEGVKGTALEPIVLKLARGNWVLPTEGIEAITVWNIFRDIDLNKVADSIQSGTPEKEAKLHVAALASRNLKEIADELQKLEDSNPPDLKGPPKDWRQNVNPADPGDLKAKAILAKAEKAVDEVRGALLIGDEPEPNNPPPLPVGDPPLEGETRGYVAEVKHSPVIKHTVTIDKMNFYTFDKSLAEYAKAAKSQKIHLLACWTVGEFGCRIETLKPIDPPKLVEELIP